MNHTYSERTPTIEKPKNISRVTLLLRWIVMTILLAGMLFISAGRLDWWMGWAYLAAYCGFLLISALVIPVEQELAEERTTVKQDAKRWDVVIVTLLSLIGALVMPIVAGLDIRNGWSAPFPVVLSVVALFLMEIGNFLPMWAMNTNRYYSRFVRIQHDRSQEVVSSGPYRYVRHPTYSGALIVAPCIAISLQSVWALIPAGIMVLLLIIRTVLEDRTLQRELPGYLAYTSRVRYRLIPGIW